jgi:serine/threonine protein kinase/tetratricopeptide (TPR) repeat protein
MQGKLVGGRYRIEQRLGKGAFGETYKAYDAHLPKHPYCVVKHLRPINTSPQVLEIAKRLFYKEAEILAELGEHPQIPRLYAYFVEGEDFYLVQEFVDGHSLDQEMQGQWSPEKVHDFVVEMMNLLEFVHSKGVIHRDIKPTNILRRKADNKLVLIDFGAIKEVSQTAMADSGLLTTSIVIGTRGYMAPEQAYGKPRFGSDIYSVGMIAIEALTGKKLRELDEDTDTGELLWKGQVSHAGSLVDIVSKMTLYDHKARYKKTNQVLIDLMSLAEFKTAPTQEQPSTPVEAPTDTESNSEVVITNQLPVETQKQEEIKEPTIPKTKIIGENKTTERQSVTNKDRRVSRRRKVSTSVVTSVIFLVIIFLVGPSSEVQSILQQMFYNSNIPDDTITTILIVIGILYTPSGILSLFLLKLYLPALVALIIVIFSAGWVALDSRKIGFIRWCRFIRQRGIPNPPDSLGSIVIALVFNVVLSWIGVFPAYLLIRQIILRGEAKIKDKQANELINEMEAKIKDKQANELINVNEMVVSCIKVSIAFCIYSACIFFVVMATVPPSKIVLRVAQEILSAYPFDFTNEVKRDRLIAKLDDLLEREPDNVKALVFRGKAKYIKGDRQGGVNDFQEAIKLDDSQRSSLSGFLIEVGDEKYNANDYKGAINNYNHAIRLNPKDVLGYFNRGRARYKNGDRQGGVNDFQEAIKLDDSQRYSVSSFLNKIGDEKYIASDYKGAINDYNYAIQLNPKYDIAYNNRGYAKNELGDYRGAIKDYDRAIQLNPNDAIAYKNRGDAKTKLGNYRGAIQDYDRAIQLNPNYTNAYFWRGYTKNELGDYRGAIQDYDRAIQLDTNDARAYHNRGYAKAGLGDYRGAIQDYDRAIQLDTKDATFYLSRGVSRLKLGDKYSAREDLLKARKLYQQSGNTKSVADVDSWLRDL